MKNKIYYLFLSFIFISSPVIANQASTKIFGWVMPDLSLEKPGSWVGNDPVFGRLACPPLTRLNLSKQKSEPLIFKYANKKEKNGKIIWKFFLRNGIYWWNGDEVIPEDVVYFINGNLKTIIKKVGSGIWDIPGYSVSSEGQWIYIEWETKPDFDLFVFNGFSLWRTKKEKHVINDFSYECAGIYRASMKSSRKDLIKLTPSKKYNIAKKELILSTDLNFLNTNGNHIEFKMADKFQSTPKSRSPFSPISCDVKIDLTQMTVINWNPKSTVINSAKLRKIIVEILPRGNILRSIGGYMGDLISAPIPRRHLGYNSDIKVRPYELTSASMKLDRLAFIRPKSNSLRVSKKGNALKIKLGSTGNNSQLLEKVIYDSLFFMGIGVEFVKKPFNIDEVDGILTGISVPWPDLNFLSNYHSKMKSIGGIYPFDDSAMDFDLEAHAVSLTKEKPNFEILKRIHKRFYDLELVSVLLHHSVCMEFGTNKNLKGRSVDIRNPDWFRKALLK